MKKSELVQLIKEVISEITSENKLSLNFNPNKFYSEDESLDLIQDISYKLYYELATIDYGLYLEEGDVVEAANQIIDKYNTDWEITHAKAKYGRDEISYKFKFGKKE